MDEQAYEAIKIGSYVLGSTIVISSLIRGLVSIVKSRYENSPELAKINDATRRQELDLEHQRDSKRLDYEHKLSLEHLAMKERDNERNLRDRVALLEVAKEEFATREDFAKRRLALMESQAYIDYMKKREEIVNKIRGNYEEKVGESFSEYNEEELEKEIQMRIGQNPLRDLLGQPRRSVDVIDDLVMDDRD